MSIVHFEEPTGEVNEVAAFSAGDTYLTVPGRLFRTGDYPTKGFSLTDAEAASEVSRFNAAGKPAAMNYEHKAGVLDGELGSIQRLYKKGAELWADFKVPSWLASKAKQNGVPLRVSAEWHKQTKRLQAAAWVLNPKIKDAELVAFHDDFINSGSKGSKGGDTRMKTKAERVKALTDAAKAEGKDVDLAEIQAIFTEDEDELERLRTSNASYRKSDLSTRAVAFATDEIVNKKRAFPFEKEAIIALFTRLEEDDEANEEVVKFSASGKQFEGGRVDAFKSLFSLRPAHGLTDELLSNSAVGKDMAKKFMEGQKALFSEDKTQGTDTDGAAKPESTATISSDRQKKLLAYTPLGTQILTNDTKAGE